MSYSCIILNSLGETTWHGIFRNRDVAVKIQIKEQEGGQTHQAGYLECEHQDLKAPQSRMLIPRGQR